MTKTESLRQYLYAAISGQAGHLVETNHYRCGTDEFEGRPEQAYWAFNCEWEFLNDSPAYTISNIRLWSIDAAGAIHDRTADIEIVRSWLEEYLAGKVREQIRADAFADAEAMA